MAQKECRKDCLAPSLYEVVGLSRALSREATFVAQGEGGGGGRPSYLAVTLRTNKRGGYPRHPHACLFSTVTSLVPYAPGNLIRLASPNMSTTGVLQNYLYQIFRVRGMHSDQNTPIILQTFTNGWEFDLTRRNSNNSVNPWCICQLGRPRLLNESGRL